MAYSSGDHPSLAESQDRTEQLAASAAQARAGRGLDPCLLARCLCSADFSQSYTRQGPAQDTVLPTFWVDLPIPVNTQVTIRTNSHPHQANRI